MSKLTRAQVKNPAALHKILDGMLTDFIAIRAGFLLLTAQLDLDAGITDTDYAANTNPAALVTVVGDPPTTDPAIL